MSSSRRTGSWTSARRAGPAAGWSWPPGHPSRSRAPRDRTPALSSPRSSTGSPGSGRRAERASMADQLPYKPKQGEIPTAPGVYRFRDREGRILYVGKAKSLRARLSNYFAPLHTLHERTRRMVTTAASVQWTVVGSEFEALQLEYTWI